jgi:hypothetical protein
MGSLWMAPGWRRCGYVLEDGVTVCGRVFVRGANLTSHVAEFHKPWTGAYKKRIAGLKGARFNRTGPRSPIWARPGSMSARSDAGGLPPGRSPAPTTRLSPPERSESAPTGEGLPAEIRADTRPPIVTWDRLRSGR